MQGFILHTQRVKDEDLIVYVLHASALFKTYRFYGLRHSSILSGYKIDFALEENSNFLPRLKDVLHLGFTWIFDREKMLIWQDFIALMYKHLKDVEKCEAFYFELLEESAKRFLKQDSKRVVVDAYLKLLEFEGRLHNDFLCFLCDEKIQDEKLILTRAFLQAHLQCGYGSVFEKNKLEIFYERKNCAVFDDEEIARLYLLIKEGF